LTVLVIFILITCATQRHLCDFMNFTLLFSWLDVLILRLFLFFMFHLSLVLVHIFF
jgi:hypothetical protein